jgi:zinc transporter ZupT
MRAAKSEILHTTLLDFNLSCLKSNNLIMKVKSLRILIVCSLLAFFAGCNTVSQDALSWTPETMAWRQQQTRRFEITDEKKVISSCAALLQDLGFTLSESETALGVLTASKDRTAVETGQVIGAAFLSVLAGTNVAHDTRQTFKASVVTRPQDNNILVRVTFQRVVWNSHNVVSRLERLNDPLQYQEFFTKLSKSLFLEAHQI